MNIPTDERVSLDEYSPGGQSDCARALAEAEKVLRELALFTRRSKSEDADAGNKARKVPALVPVGFRRMTQAHSAAIDVMIGIDGREVLRFPAQSRDGIDALPEKGITDLARASCDHE